MRQTEKKVYQKQKLLRIKWEIKIVKLKQPNGYQH